MVVLLAVVLDVTLYLSYRRSRLDELSRELDRTESLVHLEDITLEGDELARRLAAVGVDATVFGPDDPRPSGPADRWAREVALRRGGSAIISVSPDAMEESLRQLIAAEAVGTLAAAALMMLLLRWVSEVALRPLEEMAAAIRRSAAGHWEERLRPDRRDTRLGELAGAYDDMLDALQAALHEAGEARDEQSRLASSVASSDDAVVGMGPDGRIATWNRGAQRMFGYSAAEAVGQPIALISPDSVDPATRPVDHVHPDEAFPHYHSVWRRKDGTSVDVDITVSSIRDRAAVRTGTSIVARDVTEQRQMAVDLQATLAELEAALAEARVAEERTRSFLDDAAHQIRTPIAGIQACAEAMMLGTSEAETQLLLNDLVRETARAGRLVTNLLHAARIDQGLTLSPSPYDLVELCRDEAEMMQARSLGLHITVVGGHPTPESMALDGNAVREVVANLLDNARRHARSAIEVTVERWATTVEVRVADDGPGLPQAAHERVFERFVSLDGKGGSGLGLPIARSLAEAHGGTLSYDGTAFVLSLPLSDKDAPVKATT